jgi:hypothetical protein
MKLSHLSCIISVFAIVMMTTSANAALVQYRIIATDLEKTAGFGDPFGLEALNGGGGGFTVDIPDTGSGTLGTSDIVDFSFVLGDAFGESAPGQYWTDENATYFYFTASYANGLLNISPSVYPRIAVQTHDESSNGDDAININWDAYPNFYAADHFVGVLEGTATISQGSYPNPIPIPGAIWLLGSGLIGIVGIRRKLKNKQPNNIRYAKRRQGHLALPFVL